MFSYPTWFEYKPYQTYVMTSHHSRFPELRFKHFPLFLGKCRERLCQNLGVRRGLGEERGEVRRRRRGAVFGDDFFGHVLVAFRDVLLLHGHSGWWRHRRHNRYRFQARFRFIRATRLPRRRHGHRRRGNPRGFHPERRDLHDNARAFLERIAFRFRRGFKRVRDFFCQRCGFLSQADGFLKRLSPLRERGLGGLELPLGVFGVGRVFHESVGEQIRGQVRGARFLRRNQHAYRLCNSFKRLRKSRVRASQRGGDNAQALLLSSRDHGRRRRRGVRRDCRVRRVFPGVRAGVQPPTQASASEDSSFLPHFD
mmetsp:Transcript_1008/g.3849  ORF Transcript_1008/g.3849 Transcript_1008/m.3849 type:complete len:311 (+) Transcript_1008:922-1854(+)